MEEGKEKANSVCIGVACFDEGENIDAVLITQGTAWNKVSPDIARHIANQLIAAADFVDGAVTGE